MSRTRKETAPVAEQSVTEVQTEAAPAVDPIEAAKAEAEAILAKARQEAALISQAAREEAAAAKARTADWQPLPDAAPEPLPEGVQAAPEPSVTEAARWGRGGGRSVDVITPGIQRIDY